MHGRVALVTGATRGIGRVMARELAKLGAELFITARDPARAADTLEEIRRAAPEARVEVLSGDLALQSDVEKVAEAFLARDRPLDLLVNNAGAIFTTRQVTKEGREATFALNHLAYFILTRRLLGALARAPQARVVNVSSDAHYAGKLKLDDLMSERGYFGFTAYATSKLANVLFTQELARRLDGTRITTNAVHPGTVRTGFGQNNRGSVIQLFYVLAGPLLLSPASGARTPLYACLAPELDGVSGQYFKRRKARRPSGQATPENARALWEASSRICGMPVALEGLTSSGA